jgi:hypothetical protein
VRTILVNYAGRHFLKSQIKNMWTGLAAGRVDLCRSYGVGDLDPAFRKRNSMVLEAPCGAGYWLWKPYIVRDALDWAADGDAIVYCDSGSVFTGDIGPIVRLCRDTTPGVTGFALAGLQERCWTKRDAFVLMDCDTPRFHESPQIEGGLSIFINNDFARAFVDQWLHYAQDPRILTDMPNQCGHDDLPGFREHRHDQSIFSLLNKKHDLWGAPHELAYDRIASALRCDVQSPLDWLRPLRRPWYLLRWLRPVSLARRWRRPQSWIAG